MPFILHIETSTQVCSLALSADDEIIFERISFDLQSHSALAGMYAQEALTNIGGQRHLDAVAVSCGPGSYTGLRIGISLAKGICFGYDVPLIAVPTLKLLALQAVRQMPVEDNTLFCPMIDARRMEVYAAIYNGKLEEQRPVMADIIEPDSYKSFLDDHKIYFFGNGASKCREVINSPNAIFIDGLYPSAKDMVSLAKETFSKQQFEDVAYFEPFYLKEFQATIPKNRILGT